MLEIYFDTEVLNYGYNNEWLNFIMFLQTRDTCTNTCEHLSCQDSWAVYYLSYSIWQHILVFTSRMSLISSLNKHYISWIKNIFVLGISWLSSYKWYEIYRLFVIFIVQININILQDYEPSTKETWKYIGKPK